MKKKSFLFLLIFVTACDLIVDVDVPFGREQLVLTSFFNPDSLWSVTISINRHILDSDISSFKRVTDATIEIRDETSIITTLQHKENGKYISASEKPIVGKQYTIHVNSPEYGMVQAISYSPIATLIKSVDRETIINGNNQSILFRLKMQDNEETEDFYHIKLEEIHEHYHVETGEIRTSITPVLIQSNNPELNDPFISADKGLLVKDILFNGQETEIKFRVGPSGDYKSGVRITLKSLSKDYYNYLATRQLQIQNNTNPLAQPINVYNNVVNGFGIFGGLSTSVFSEYEAKDPVVTSFEPTSAKPGDLITIRGINFIDALESSDPILRFYSGDNKYSALAEIHELGDTYLKVFVPASAATGKVLIGNGRKFSISDMEFLVTN
jgi:hypothetical protein